MTEKERTELLERLEKEGAVAFDKTETAKALLVSARQNEERIQRLVIALRDYTSPTEE